MNNEPLATDDIEMALLGALFINNAMLECPDVLRLEQVDFSSVRNWRWLEVFREVYSRTQYLDALIVKACFGAEFSDMGGYDYLGSIQWACNNSLMAPDYAVTLSWAGKTRRKMAAALDIAQATAVGDEAKATAAVREMQKLSEKDVRAEYWPELVSEGWSRFEGWIRDPKEVRGLATGIGALDRNLGGIQRGLISLYGATSMGKSMFTRQLTRVFAEQGAQVVVIPSEMAPAEMFDNMAGESVGISVKKLRSGHLTQDEQERLFEALTRMTKLPIVTMDQPSPTPKQVREFVRARKREHRCDVLIIDSASNMSVEGQSGIYEVSRQVANDLAEISYYEQIPVVASWQIGRNDKYRSSPVPQLGDGKGASEIEYNSHVVIGLFRPHYYTAKGRQVPDQYQGCRESDAFLMILKDRSGGSGDGVIPVIYAPGHGLVGIEQTREP